MTVQGWNLEPTPDSAALIGTGLVRGDRICKPNCKTTRHSMAPDITSRDNRSKSGEREHTLRYCAGRTSMRVLELENRCTGNRTVGSNPTPSAKSSVIVFLVRMSRRDLWG